MSTTSKGLLSELKESFPIYDINDLTKGHELAYIKLNEQLYTLRITRTGKLILTK